MEDRFKFRAWDELNEHIVDFNRYGDKAEDFWGMTEPHDWKVMQATGLRDKNGKLIYEGDILKAYKPNSYLNGVHEVRWHDKKGRWYYHDQPSFKDLYQVGCEGNLDCEIIGNIHENPELLKPNA